MFIENAECDAEEKKPRQKSRPERKEDTVLRQEMLEMRIAHLQEKEMIRQQMKDEHDREMAELRRLMQTTIDAQQAQINIMERDLAKKENQTYIGLVADPIEKPHDKD